MGYKEEVNQLRVEAFNKKNPIGANVLVVRDSGEIVEGAVKHPAQLMSGEAVAWVTGISGSYLLERIF